MFMVLARLLLNSFSSTQCRVGKELAMLNGLMYLNFTAAQIAYRKKIIILTLLTFAAMC